jgi:hypothetical protein
MGHVELEEDGALYSTAAYVGGSWTIYLAKTMQWKPGLAIAPVTISKGHGAGRFLQGQWCLCQ